MVDVLSFDNPDEEPVAMVEESLSGNRKSNQWSISFSSGIKNLYGQVFGHRV